MIGISDLSKSFGARTLFEGVTRKLVKGSRYGLVGANGSGKTTFLKILCGDEPATGSQVVWPKDARVAAHDGYTLEARASHILEGLGIPVPVHRQPLATLSGGFKLRVLLAQVLIGGPDVVLLDEPTNHLDILSIRWLEKFLAQYRGCALVISHDQRFLDNVSTHILDVDYGTIDEYPGNYTATSSAKRPTFAPAKKPRSRAPKRRSPRSAPGSSASAPRPARPAATERSAFGPGRRVISHMLTRG